MGRKMVAIAKGGKAPKGEDSWPSEKIHGWRDFESEVRIRRFGRELG